MAEDDIEGTAEDIAGSAAEEVAGDNLDMHGMVVGDTDGMGTGVEGGIADRDRR